MMAAKAVGGSFAMLYDPRVAQTKQRELQLRFDLAAALERDEFVLHYQPKVSLSTRNIIGAEALIRWRHPTLGLVPPSEFISIAEESSLILTLGKWVIDRALSDLGRWSTELGDEFSVSINVSPRQLADPTFPAMVAARIGAHGVLPSTVELEVTEGMLVADFNASERVLRQVQRMGVSIALDDFGTGYSSLAYVMRFPVNTIKIDRSFVHDLDPDPGARANAGGSGHRVVQVAWTACGGRGSGNRRTTNGARSGGVRLYPGLSGQPSASSRGVHRFRESA
ncbi:EAL domain-containing protein [Cupriavidus sp. D39]|nr:EAL domain-containing protein [Cupriavidus sp. D39]MCY0852594.1 EAL domain-containing protein [Cupriavidus sp. D39]